MRFVCIVDDTPEESPRLLREACAARGIEFLEVNAPAFLYDADQRLSAGDLLFRPAVSTAARFVEQFLHREGVATFYADSSFLHRDVVLPRLILERAGISVPPTVYAATSEKDVLDRYIDRLGGFPIVASLGGEGGRGTLLLDSRAAFYSTLEFCADHGLVPALSALVPDAMHWRIVVVGGKAIASFPNPVKPDDFRSKPSSDPAAYRSDVEEPLARLACAATAALGITFSGVDVLRAPGRDDVVLEVNFPCYFPKAQLMAGIDVAGAMVDALVTTAVSHAA